MAGRSFPGAIQEDAGRSMMGAFSLTRTPGKRYGLTDLKPAHARKIVERAARFYDSVGLDPNVVHGSRDNFQGRRDVVDGCDSVIFTYGANLIYYAEVVPVKHLKRGKKRG
jgi:hypothetical protein